MQVIFSAIEYESGYSIRYSYCEMLQTDAYDTRNKTNNHTDVVIDGIRDNQSASLPIIN
jgi:hypothetical protein